MATYLNLKDTYFIASPQVEAAMKLLPLGDLILLRPDNYKKLTPPERQRFYGYRQLLPEYQELVREVVDVAFEESYLPSQKNWRGSFIGQLKESLSKCEEPEKERLGRIISVFESVLAENYIRI